VAQQPGVDGGQHGTSVGLPLLGKAPVGSR
jgi:hypothetical protein